MSAALQTVQTVTEFARNPNLALKKIDKGDIILRRTKGKGSIRVSLESRARAESIGMGEMARVLALFIQKMLPGAASVIVDVLTKYYPWVEFLPEADRLEFGNEFIRKMEACASINNFSDMDVIVSAWKRSAEIHADPELRADLTRPVTAHAGSIVTRP
jgi:hypothetical protein